VAVRLIELLRERFGVREVAVVREHDPEGGVHVEGLRLLVRARAPLRRVANLAHAHRASQVAHVARAEDVAHEAHRLVHVEGQPVQRRDARRILTTVLQEQKRVVETLVDRFTGHDGNNTAHDVEYLVVPLNV
jgi:hypothetical protein